MSKPALLEIDEDSHNLTDLLQTFLRENPAITGIFASNDFLALATIRSARALALDVPDDLSIVGFDGIEVGSMVEPSLATIVTDPKMLGAGAGKTVISVIDGTAPPDTPDPDQTFSFRAGGSLAPLVAESEDDGKAATFPPSNDLTKRRQNPNRRDQNEI